MKRKNDLLLIGSLLLAALLVWFLVRPGEMGGWAVVTVDGQENGRYPLDVERTVTIGEDAYNILYITGGTVSVVEANCGDHTCVRTGSISREGETIVCLPHRLVVRVEGGAASGFDAAAE